LEKAAYQFVDTDGDLYSNIRHAYECFPRKIAFEFMGKKTSYASFNAQIDRAAKALLALGVQEGEIVGIAMPNAPQAVILFYALNKIGAVANMIHPLSSENEMEQFLNRVHARTLLMMDRFYGSVQHIRRSTGLENIIIAAVSDALPGYMKLPYWLTAGRKIKKIPLGEKVIFWKDFLKLGDGTESFREIHNNADKMALILHSGGTTGKIKGVCLSNRNINCSVRQMLSFNPMLCPEDKMLTVMPIFHGNGLIVGLHLMLSTGAECVLIPRFTPASYAKDLVKHRCNYISGVPALFGRIMEVPALQKADLSFLKGVFSGADFLSEEMEHRVNAFLAAHHSPVFVRQGYGMTEGVVATTLMPPDCTRPGSIGKPFPGVTLKIVKPGTDAELPCGEIGEIAFSSVTNMMGYYDDPQETAITLMRHSDGLTYIHSGDLGSVDKEGFVYFKGRIKRMIVTNGYNVFPIELENTIESHPMVDRCCVLGVPDRERTERVKAYIVLKPGFEPNEKNERILRDYFYGHIARYAVPREIEFMSELPKTKVGKTDFAALLRKETSNDDKNAAN